MPELVFEWLAQSRWSLDRQFDNPKMPGLSASGEARFLLLATNQLYYLEEGVLSAGGSFSKRYTFTWVPDGIEVVHDDPHNRGQAFQTLVLAPNDQGAWMCRASNFCAPDHYQSLWCFAQDYWRMHHDVSGPRKQYGITTMLTRLS